MAFDQFVHASNSPIQSAPLRNNFVALKALVDQCPTRDEMNTAIATATGPLSEMAGTPPLNLTIQPAHPGPGASHRRPGGLATGSVAGGVKGRDRRKRQRTAALQELASVRALRMARQRRGVRQSSAAFGRTPRTPSRHTTWARQNRR